MKVGFCGLLTLILIYLKLSGTINISWMLALAPLWAPVVLLLGIIIICAMLGVLVVKVTKKGKRIL